MNRCYFVILLAILSFSVLAQDQSSVLQPATEALVQTGTPGLRKFPANALRGKLKVVQPPDILIDGMPERLSPGSRIRDQQQRIVMSASINQQELIVNFVRNPTGDLQEVWILTPAEIAQKIKPNTPPNNFRFASDAELKKQDDGKTPFNQLPSFEQIGRQQREQQQPR